MAAQILEILLAALEFQTDHPHCDIDKANSRTQTSPDLDEDMMLLGSDPVRLYMKHISMTNSSE